MYQTAEGGRRKGGKKGGQPSIKPICFPFFLCVRVQSGALAWVTNEARGVQKGGKERREIGEEKKLLQIFQGSYSTVKKR